MEEQRETPITEVAEGPSIPAQPETKLEQHADAVQEESAYGIKIRVDRPYDSVLASVREALKEEGFGIIAEIDVRRTFKEKLAIEFPQYVILGACNPRYAHLAMELDMDIGLLLPCNVVVYERAGGTVVETIDPIAQLALADSSDLRDLAIAVKQNLQDVINRVAAGLV